MQSTQQRATLGSIRSESFATPIQEVTSTVSSYVTRLQNVIARVQESVAQFFTQVQTGLASVLASCVAINQCILSIQGLFTPNFATHRSSFSEEQLAAMIKNISVPK